MTEQVGDAWLSAIEEVNISASESTDEKDLLNNNSNFLFLGERQADEIEISFVIVEADFVDTSLQIDDLNQLAFNDASENDFIYQGQVGFISVEDVSIPDDGSVSNLRRGTVSGKFLSWPKHFPNEDKPEQEPLGSLYGSSGYGQGVYGKDVGPGSYGFFEYGDGDYGD